MSHGADDNYLPGVPQPPPRQEQADATVLTPPARADSSALDATTAPPPPREGAPNRETIGPYRLLRQIGEGGMGEVWLAEQTRPVKRQVALKVIKAGMDTTQVVRRFDA
jgi:serine/threonine protein kinase